MRISTVILLTALLAALTLTTVPVAQATPEESKCQRLAVQALKKHKGAALKKVVQAYYILDDDVRAMPALAKEHQGDVYVEVLEHDSKNKNKIIASGYLMHTDKSGTDSCDYEIADHHTNVHFPFFDKKRMQFSMITANVVPNTQTEDGISVMVNDGTFNILVHRTRGIGKARICLERGNWGDHGKLIFDDFAALESMRLDHAGKIYQARLSSSDKVSAGSEIDGDAITLKATRHQNEISIDIPPHLLQNDCPSFELSWIDQYRN